MTAKKSTAKKVTPTAKKVAPRQPPKKAEPRVLDLDALRSARWEKAGDAPAPVVRIGGEEYELPRSLPAEFIFALGAVQNSDDLSRLEPAVRLAFGEYADEVIGILEVEDLMILMMKLPELYGADLGGILGLRSLLEEHFAELEADFQRFYGLDLSDELWGESPITFRRLKNLILQIPLDGALGRARGAYAAQPWKNAEELLAVICELIDSSNRLFVKANSKKGQGVRGEPLKIKRPLRTNEKPTPKRNATSADLAKIFGPAGRRPPKRRRKRAN